jgi:hypothetical protein
MRIHEALLAPESFTMNGACSMAGINDRNQQQTGMNTGSGTRDWTQERSWWQENYRTRPYATADRGFDYYEPGYRYGTEAANRYRGRSWEDAENDLRSGWDSYEGRARSTWEEIKASVRDAWDRVTGDDNDRNRRL